LQIVAGLAFLQCDFWFSCVFKVCYRLSRIYWTVESISFFMSII